MKRKQSIFGCLILGAVLMLFSGCTSSNSAEKTEPEIFEDKVNTISASDAESIYDAAVNTVKNAQSLSFSVEYTREINSGEVTFSEDCVQTIIYQDYGTEQLRARVSEVRNIGTNAISATATFEDGVGYFAVGDGRFCGSMSADAFSSKYVPAALMESSLYANIHAVEEGGTVTVFFSKPSEPEHWLNLTETTDFDAAGKAVLGSNGQLLESTYNFSFQHGGTKISQSVRVTLETSPVHIEADDYTGYIPLDIPDAPMMLERVCGYLLQAGSVKAESKETVVFDAYGDERVQTSSLEMTGKGATFAANFVTSVELINHNRAGLVTENHYAMDYTDGHYRISENGEIKQEQVKASSETVRNDCQNLLLGTVILPEYISSAEVIDLGDTYLYSYSANDAFCLLMRQKACHTLYQDHGLLQALESQEASDAVSAYLKVDKLTGLPVGSGIKYSGTFTVGEYAYSLHSNADQSYRLLESNQ